MQDQTKPLKSSQSAKSAKSIYESNDNSSSKYKTPNSKTVDERAAELPFNTRAIIYSKMKDDWTQKMNNGLFYNSLIKPNTSIIFNEKIDKNLSDEKTIKLTDTNDNDYILSYHENFSNTDCINAIIEEGKKIKNKNVLEISIITKNQKSLLSNNSKNINHTYTNITIFISLNEIIIRIQLQTILFVMIIYINKNKIVEKIYINLNIYNRKVFYDNKADNSNKHKDILKNNMQDILLSFIFLKQFLSHSLNKTICDFFNSPNFLKNFNFENTLSNNLKNIPFIVESNDIDKQFFEEQMQPIIGTYLFHKTKTGFNSTKLFENVSNKNKSTSSSSSSQTGGKKKLSQKNQEYQKIHKNQKNKNQVKAKNNKTIRVQNKTKIKQ